MPLKIITDLWLPFVVAMMVSVALAFSSSRRSKSLLNQALQGAMSRGLAAAVAISAGMIALHLLNFGKPSWPPPSLTERSLLAIAAAGVAGILASFSKRTWLSGLVAYLGVSTVLAITVWPMLMPLDELSKPTLLMIAGVSLLAILSIVALADIHRREHPVAAAIILTGLGWAVGIGLLGSGNMVLGQFGFAVGATGLALLLVPIVMRRGWPTIRIGGATAAFAILAGLLLAGNRYSELRLIPSFLFALPVPLAAIVVRVFSRSMRPRWIGVIAVIVAALMAGTAGGLAIDLPKQEVPSGQDDEYAALEHAERHRIGLTETS